MKKTKNNKTVGVITLGCDKNRVDTEFILTRLSENGWTFTNDYNVAQIILINTCSFIKASRTEGFEIINEAISYKKKNNFPKIVICGCLAEKNSAELEELKGIDAIVGVNQYNDISSILDNVVQGLNVKQIGGKDCLYYAKNRKITTPINYAYLKIADGCNNFCTFCRIPYIRGRYRSQKMELLIEEAKSLVSFGTTELVLVAQDITKYGIDIYNKPMLVELIQNLSKIDGLKRIRLLYAYPESITNELIDEIQNNPKVCKYLDIPLQHIADSILKKMNRKSNEKSIHQLIEKLRTGKNYISIRSTFMLGFPGETKEDFQKLCEFLETYKLDNVGFFKYSSEVDTVAGNFEETVTEEEKERRLNVVSKLQQKISKEVLKQFKGKILNVVVEGINEDSTMFIGRNEYQSPDVDGVTYFYADEDLCLGDYVDIKITQTKDYDLKGDKV